MRINNLENLVSGAIVLSVILVAMLVTAPSALADQILLKNGDRLTGKITRLQDGKLTIETNLEGTVVVPFENVSTFSTDDPIDLRLDDGSALKQRVNASDTDRRIEVVVSEVLGGQTISLDRVKEINPRPTQWDGSLTLSAEIDTGNTKERTYSVRFEALRRSKLDRISFFGNYDGERTKSSGEWVTTKRETQFSLDYDYFVTEKTFVWGGASAETDGMADLDLRLIAGAGIGYQWIERDDLKINSRAGLTWVSANYSDETDDDSYVGARFGMRVDYQILSNVKFFSTLDWIPSLEDSKDQLVKATAGVRADITSAIYGEARVDWEWDSTAAEDADRQDATYLLGIGWQF